MVPTTVWIEEGCIACGACETVCPAVFIMEDDTVRIVAEVRVDGTTDDNRDARSPLKPERAAELAAAIEEAAESCPVEVIHRA